MEDGCLVEGKVVAVATALLSRNIETHVLRVLGFLYLLRFPYASHRLALAGFAEGCMHSKIQELAA